MMLAEISTGSILSRLRTWLALRLIGKKPYVCNVRILGGITLARGAVVSGCVFNNEMEPEVIDGIRHVVVAE